MAISIERTSSGFAGKNTGAFERMSYNRLALSLFLILAERSADTRAFATSVEKMSGGDEFVKCLAVLVKQMDSLAGIWFGQDEFYRDGTVEDVFHQWSRVWRMSSTAMSDSPKSW